MGGFASQVQAPQTGGQSSGKMGPVSQAAQQVSSPEQQQYQPPQPMGKGGYTNSATSGQPRIGMQNQYSNTVGQWDNTQIQTPQSNAVRPWDVSQIQPVQSKRGGKGKGG